jgi:hydrogenase maturation protein HypF
MLPYTPLHQLLLDHGRYAALVMTSGNRRDEPIVIDNEAALAALATIADFFLLHDRPILNRADDSVVAVMHTATPTLSPVRRSRGYVPEPIRLPRPAPRAVLAVGGDLKNTCGLTRGAQAILSQHIGDLEHPAAAEMLEITARRLAELFGVEPELVVHDLHPDYHSTRFAEELGLPRLAVQHHHAHVLACLAESGHRGPALAIVLDGTGFGTDGAIWGGELLRVDGLAFERLAHLRYLPLPGGDQAARYPWRMALAALTAAFGSELPRNLPPFEGADPPLVEAVLKLCSHKDTLLTSSTGRLFDAAASLLGLRHETSFEGQAAMELERLARESEHGDLLPWRVDGEVIDLLPAVRALVDATTPRHHLARAFHNTLAAALVEAAARAADQTGLRTVALSGGSLQNRILHRLLVDGLAARELEVLIHRRVPPNDGGLALGQLWAGALKG